MPENEQGGQITRQKAVELIGEEAVREQEGVLSGRKRRREDSGGESSPNLAYYEMPSTGSVWVTRADEEDSIQGGETVFGRSTKKKKKK